MSYEKFAAKITHFSRTGQKFSLKTVFLLKHLVFLHVDIPSFTISWLVCTFTFLFVHPDAFIVAFSPPLLLISDMIIQWQHVVNWSCGTIIYAVRK